MKAKTNECLQPMNSSLSTASLSSLTLSETSTTMIPPSSSELQRSLSNSALSEMETFSSSRTGRADLNLVLLPGGVPCFPRNEESPLQGLRSPVALSDLLLVQPKPRVLRIPKADQQAVGQALREYRDLLIAKAISSIR